MTKRVFISYSHDSDAHARRVLELADQLRVHGLDVRLDQYVQGPPEGWPRWLATQVVEADFVLLICTAGYQRRFAGEPPDGDPGVTWEAMIAQQLVFEAGGLNHKLIPVLFEDADEDDVPLVFKPFTRYRLAAQYEDLYRQLTDQPKYPAPPLGPIRAGVGSDVPTPGRKFSGL